MPVGTGYVALQSRSWDLLQPYRLINRCGHLAAGVARQESGPRGLTYAAGCWPGSGCCGVFDDPGLAEFSFFVEFPDTWSTYEPEDGPVGGNAVDVAGVDQPSLGPDFDVCACELGPVCGVVTLQLS